MLLTGCCNLRIGTVSSPFLGSKHRLKGEHWLRFVGLNYAFYQVNDLVEADSTVVKSLYSLLIGSVVNRRVGQSSRTHLTSQSHCTENAFV